MTWVRRFRRKQGRKGAQTEPPPVRLWLPLEDFMRRSLFCVSATLCFFAGHPGCDIPRQARPNAQRAAQPGSADSAAGCGLAVRTSISPPHPRRTATPGDEKPVTAEGEAPRPSGPKPPRPPVAPEEAPLHPVCQAPRPPSSSRRRSKAVSRSGPAAASISRRISRYTSRARRGGSRPGI